MLFGEIILESDFTRWKSTLQVISQNDEVIKIKNPGTTYDISYSYNPYGKNRSRKIFSMNVDVMDYVENVFIKFDFKRISRNCYKGSNTLYRNMENVIFRFIKRTKKYLTVLFCINKDLSIMEILEAIEL